MFGRVRKKLDDPDPTVKLRAAQLLARGGEPIPGEFARVYLSSAPIAREKKNEELVAVQKQAVLPLGYVGDESDFPMLDVFIERRGGLNNFVRDQRGGEALFARAWIKLRLARTPEERAGAMDNVLRTPHTSRAYEALEFLHRNGDKQVRPAIERAAADKSNPEWGYAKRWLREQDGKGYGP